MAKLFQRTQPELIGIDISTMAVNMLEIKPRGKNFNVVCYGQEFLPKDVVNEKVIKNLEAVAGAIEHLIAKYRPSTKSVAMAVAGSAVITKVVQLSAELSEDDLESQIIIEADRYIPYPLDEVNIHFEVLRKNVKDRNLVDVLVAASRMEHVDARVDAAMLAGLKVEVIDVEAYAMERVLALNAAQIPGDIDARTIAVLDIGDTITTFSIIHAGEIIYTREQAFGGLHIVTELQNIAGITYEEALPIFFNQDFPEGFDIQVLDDYCASVVAMASRALQFFFSSSQYTKVDSIILSGSGANIPGLQQRIAEKMETNTQAINPFENMSISGRVDSEALRKQASSLLVCCGLALRSVN